jgi:hypothetical protein
MPWMSVKGVEKNILKDRRGRSHQHDRVAEHLRPDVAVHHAVVGNVRKGSGTAAEVDVELLPRGQGRRAQAALGRDLVDRDVPAVHGLALEPWPERSAPDMAVLVEDLVHRRHRRRPVADHRQRQVHVGLRVELLRDGGDGRGQHHVAGPGDRGA